MSKSKTCSSVNFCNHSLNNNLGTGKMIDKGNSPHVLLLAGCERHWDWASLKMTVITLLLLTPCN